MIYINNWGIGMYKKSIFWVYFIICVSLFTSSSFPQETPNPPVPAADPKTQLELGLYSDVSSNSGIYKIGARKFHGACFGDYNGDNLLDIFITCEGPQSDPDLWQNVLLKNNGDGTFINVAEEAGVNYSGVSNAAVWGDYDNDGDLDLFVANKKGENLLYQNQGDGRFKDVTEISRLNQAQKRTWSAFFFDYDRDGFLDLFLCVQYANNVLFRNSGDGTFKDVTADAGLVTDGQWDFAIAATAFDYDNDQDPDLYVCYWSREDILYRNEGNGTFINVSVVAGLTFGNGSSAVDAGDYNNDGFLDLMLATTEQEIGNRLYQNNGDGTFKDATEKAGLVAKEEGSSVSFTDFNNDGYLDLFIANWNETANQVYRNMKDGTFQSVSGVILPNTLTWGQGNGLFDYDRDGDLDLLITRCGDGARAPEGQLSALFQNTLNDHDLIEVNHWLGLTLIGTVSNRSAIGARVSVTAEGLTQIREVTSGPGKFHGNSLDLEFGLGRASSVEVVEIIWPSGKIQKIGDIKIDSYTTISEPGEVPTADFTATPLNGVAPLGVTFTNASSGTITDYVWTFTGGTPAQATGAGPHKVVYANPGTFSASLTVSSSLGSDTKKRNDYIRVYRTPLADFSGNPTSGTQPLAVVYSDLSTGDIANWNWTFTGGVPFSATGKGPHSVVYQSAGKYSAALNVVGPSGITNAKTRTDYIQVYATPTANFGADKVIGGTPLTVTFTDQSTGDLATWNWSFPGGNPGQASGRGPHAVVYATTGSYSVSLIVTGMGGALDTTTKVNYIKVESQPYAAFVADKTLGGVPLTITYTDQSSGNITDWQWSFPGGNPATQTGKGPHSVTYAAAGFYSVSLVVTGPGGSNSHSKNNYIEVAASPVANFYTPTRKGGVPLTVTFIDSSQGNITSWNWSFTDGTPSSKTGKGPHEITYNQPGIYSITLAVTGPGGTNQVTKSNYVTVSAKPAADFTATPTIGGKPLVVLFTDKSTGEISNWNWSFPGGTPATRTGAGPHTISYNAEGNFEVSLEVTGPGGSDLKTVSQCINVSAAPNADFTVNKRQGGAPFSVIYTDNSSGNITGWGWSFPGGNPNLAATQGPHTVIYADPGDFNVQLQVTGPGGTHTKAEADYIHVSAKPMADFNASDTRGGVPLRVTFNDNSTGEIQSWEWSFPGGEPASATGQGPHSIIYKNPGQYTITLSITGPGGADTLTKANYVTVLTEPVANFNWSTISGVVPQQITFTDQSTGSISEWNWSFPGGQSDAATGSGPHTITYQTFGHYAVTLQVTGPGGSHQTTKNFQIIAPPQPNFGVDKSSGNAPLQVTFSDSSQGDITNWNWTFSGAQSLNAIGVGPHTIIYSEPGLYSVRLSVTGPGGTREITKANFIQVWAKPTADFRGAPLRGGAPLMVTFQDSSAGNIIDWQWRFPGGIPTTASGKGPHTVSYSEAGTYAATLVVTGPAGVDSLTRADYITVLAGPLADFIGAPLKGGAPLQVTFVDESTGDLTAWLWQFPGGLPASAQSRGPHVITYQNAGKFDVSLNITAASGTDSLTKKAYISVETAPVAAFTADNSRGSVPLTVTFTDQSTGNIATWQWSFPGGLPSSATGKGPHTTIYNSPGTYPVTLTVGGTSGQNTLTQQDYIIVVNTPTADFSGDKLTGSVPLTVKFSDLSTGSITNWFWSFPGGVPLSSVGEGPHDVRYDSPGQFTVTLNIAGPGGADTKPRENYIYVSSAPIAAFSADATTGTAPLTVKFADESNGQITAWGWSFSGGTPTSTNGKGPHTVVYQQAGTFSVNLLVLGPGGSDSEIKTDYIRVTEAGDRTPPTISFTPIVTSDAKQAITIQATIEDNLALSKTRVYYRMGGQKSYTELPFTAISPVNYTAQIPTTALTERGLEYYLSAEDAALNRTTIPANDAANRPVMVRVLSANLQFPQKNPSRAYRLISIPNELLQNTPAAVLEDDLGSYSNTAWRLFHYQGGMFVEYTHGNLEPFYPGKAFWLVTRDSVQLDTGSGRSVTTAAPFEIILNPGWNMLGNPFAFTVDWAGVTSSGNVEKPVAYSGTSNEASGYRYQQTKLEPWTGYLIHNLEAVYVTLSIPPKEAASALTKAVTSKKLNPLKGEWQLQIHAVSEGTQDTENYLGCLQTAQTEWDSCDFTEAPPIGNYLTVTFPHPQWKRYAGDYTADFRLVTANKISWDFEVTTNLTYSSVTLDFAFTPELPRQRVLVLIDKQRQQALQLNPAAHYTFNTGANPERNHAFQVVLEAAGVSWEESEYAALAITSFKLWPNYPNPFNPGTVIGYHLKEASQVRLQIWNVLGERVAELVPDTWQETGFHEVYWNGRNQLDKLVAAGVYFCEIKIQDRQQHLLHRQVQKMMLLK